MTSNKPIPLAFCITELEPGGAERALVNLVVGLDRTEWSPHIYSLMSQPEQDAQFLVERLAEADIPVTYLGIDHPLRLYRALRLCRLLKRQRPALIQSFLFHANLIGCLAGWWANIPVRISGIRVAERRSKWRLRLERQTEAFVSAHVACCHAVAQFSIRKGGLSPEKMHVIRNGVDIERFENASSISRRELGLPDSARILLFVGRLNVQKNPDLLLEAAIPMMKSDTSLHVVLAGDGALRHSLMRRVLDENLASQVHFPGWRSDIPAIMKISDCLVLPSRWEGLPNVVLEAMASRLPVIASDVDGNAEMVESGKTGLLFPPDSPEALRSAISRVLESPGFVHNLAASAQQFVQKEFTPGAVIRNYEDLYRRLLAD